MKYLFVSISFPYPPLKADSVFVYNIIKEMSSPESVITLSFETNYNKQNANIIEKYSSKSIFIKGIKGLSFFQIAKALISKRPFSLHRYDFDKLENAIRKICQDYYIDRILFIDANLIEMGYRLRNLKTPLYFHTIDSIFNNLEIRSNYEKFNLKKKYCLNQAKKWRKHYKLFLTYFEKTIIVTNEEKNSFKELLQKDPFDKIEVLPHGIDTNCFKPEKNIKSEYPILIFHGSMNIESEAAILDILIIFKELSEIHPEISLYLVGKNPSKKIMQLVKPYNNIHLTGYVKDIRPYLRKATLGIYPMRIGSGIKDRVLEAMSMSLPVITTKMGAYGIDIKNNKNGIIHDDIPSMIKSALTIISNSAIRQKLGKEARRTIIKDYKWEKILASLNRITKNTSE